MLQSSPENRNTPLKRERTLRGWTQKGVAGRIGTDGYTVNRWERGRAIPSPYFRQKLCELFEKNAEELGLLNENTRAAKTPGYPARWNVHHRRNLFFIGRDQLLIHLHQELQKPQRTNDSRPLAICGLGGIGKTQLAVEYAYRYQQNYEAVLWLQADSPSLLRGSLLSLADVLDIPEKQAKNTEAVIAGVRSWLGRHERWLLIIDNVENLQQAGDYLPAWHAGHVLYTTRAASPGTLACRIELEVMPPEEGALLLLRKAQLISISSTLEQANPLDQHAALELSGELGGLPLALDQAAAYIEKTGCGVSGYLRRYRKDFARLLTIPDPHSDYPASVATTWSLSFEKIRHSHPAAADILRICALLSSEEIPEELFSKGASHFGPLIQNITSDELHFDSAISELRNFSLIRRNADRQTLSLHHLVQVIVKQQMSEQAQQQIAKRVIRALNACLPPLNSEPTTWSDYQRYLPHILKCAYHIKQWEISSPEAARILHQAGKYMQERGLSSQAERVFQQILAMRKQGPSSQVEPLSLQAFSALRKETETPLVQLTARIGKQGTMHAEQGAYSEAGEKYQRAVERGEQAAEQDLSLSQGHINYWPDATRESPALEMQSHSVCVHFPFVKILLE